VRVPITWKHTIPLAMFPLSNYESVPLLPPINDHSSVSLSRPETLPWLPPITDRPPPLMDSMAPASPSYINHPKVKMEEEKVDVTPEERAVKADVEDSSQLRLDSISEATTTAMVWVLKGNNGSTDEPITFGGAVLAGNVLFFVILLGRIHRANDCGGLDDFFPFGSPSCPLSAPLLWNRIDFFAASARRR
jgi:hypothetical protein